MGSQGRISEMELPATLKYTIDSGEIISNIQKLNEDLKEQLVAFDNYDVADETQVGEGKEVLAKLRKIKKLINDEKKAIKKEVMLPYTEFETHVKDMFKEIEERENNIDKQIKKYEELWRADKETEIKEHWDTLKASTDIDIDFIWNDKWLNKGYKEKDWQQDLADWNEQIIADMEYLDDMGFDNITQLKLDYINNNLDKEKAVARYLDRQSGENVDDKEAERITILKSRYDELLEIERKYYKLKENE